MIDKSQTNILNIFKIFPLLVILVYICIKFDNYMFKKSKSSRQRNKNKNKDSSKAGHLLISKEQMDMMIDTVLSKKRVFIYNKKIKKNKKQTILFNRKKIKLIEKNG